MLGTKLGTTGCGLLQAEDELDQQEWMEAIQGVTACLLNGDVDIDALSRAQPKPARPTHSRQGSRAGVSFVTAFSSCTRTGSDRFMYQVFEHPHTPHPNPSQPCGAFTTLVAPHLIPHRASQPHLDPTTLCELNGNVDIQALSRVQAKPARSIQ